MKRAERPLYVAVIGMANETSRLANGYRVPVESAFE
jgi:hypothetical protein